MQFNANLGMILTFLSLALFFGTTWGRQVLTTTAANPLRVSADGSPIWRSIGITVDWATVAAAGSNVTWNDGIILYAGQKGLRYGQVLCKITATGKFGPFDPAASDGRQTLALGDVVILDSSMLEKGSVPGLSAVASDHPGVLEGGLVWWDRVLHAGTGTASLAAGPQAAALLAVMPLIRPRKTE